MKKINAHFFCNVFSDSDIMKHEAKDSNVEQELFIDPNFQDKLGKSLISGRHPPSKFENIFLILLICHFASWKK